jgi:hypothetical protein
MCWLCEDFDRYIAHYREVQSRTIDPLTRKSIEILILKAEAKKHELHAPGGKPTLSGRREQNSLKAFE